MKLDTFSVKHYKSLSDVTVKFDPNVTVIVGANSVGKSNFVDAMRFLRDGSEEGFDRAVHKRGGAWRLIDRTPDANLQNMRFDVTTVPDSHSAEFKQGKQFLEISCPEADRLVVATASTPSKDFTHFLTGWKFPGLFPAVLREFRLSDYLDVLRDDGSNWASVVRAAEKTPAGRSNLARINEMMAYVLPDFVDVTIKVIGSYLVPQFRFKSDEPDAVFREFDPVQLSDGTLRIYGILLALYQSPPPPLLVIEEPDQTVHPGVLAMLAEAFKEVGEVTQLVITTHSPDLVKHFAPEQVRVASMRNGATSISALHQNQIEAVNEGLFGLDEFMAGEGLRPVERPADAP